MYTAIVKLLVNEGRSLTFGWEGSNCHKTYRGGKDGKDLQKKN